MKQLPIIVAQTEVGKNVEVKIWRNKKEISKKVKLGRLETSEDFKVTKKSQPKNTEIEDLKITVKKITDEDIETRNLPKDTTGLIITKIENDSPLIKSIRVNSIIIEAQKRKIKTIGDLKQVVAQVLRLSLIHI